MVYDAVIEHDELPARASVVLYPYFTPVVYIVAC